MPGKRAKHKRSPRPKQPPLEQQVDDIPEDRPGLPRRDSIKSVETFRSPQGEEYTILHTSETDANSDRSQ